MKVLVAGAGAIGGWLGAGLAMADVDVTLLGRAPLADAVGRDGLHVEGCTTWSGPIPVITSPRGGPYDVVFVTSKAHATAALAAEVAPVLASDGAFVTLQNGLGNAEALAAHVPADRVVVGITSHGVMVKAPGRLVHAGRGALRIGPHPGHDPGRAVQVVEHLLDAAGLAPETVQDTRAHLWMKGAVNGGINPLCALHGIPNGGLRDHWEEARGLVEEVVALSRAAGVGLPGDAVQAMEQTVAATADNRCSMLQDVEARRPTEVDHITGYFVRVARRLGYPLFDNEHVYRRVKALEVTYLGQAAADTAMRRAAQAFVWP